MPTDMNRSTSIRRAEGEGVSQPTYRMKICATGEIRDIYPEHEAALFAAIERRTGIDEAFARATLHTSDIRHPDMIVTRAVAKDHPQQPLKPIR
jgi:hypothetical protein